MSSFLESGSTFYVSNVTLNASMSLLSALHRFIAMQGREERRSIGVGR